MPATDTDSSTLAARVLRPRAVAVVGASADPRKRGHQVLRALADAGYPGRVYPVNPRGGALLGRPVIPTLDELPGPVDLALVCTPAASTPEVVAACGRAGIPVAVLLAVGFGESGDQGARLEATLLAAAREHGVRLIGPNTSGLMNLPAGLNLIGAPGVRAGSLGLIVQSGNLALNLMLDATRRSADGPSVCLGVGNELDLGFADFLSWLADDEATRALLVHAEGFRRGPETLLAAGRAARRKPVVLLKGARRETAGAAARSHTGALAGRYEVLRAALRQAGVIEVERSDELFHVGHTLAHQPPLPPGVGVAVLSDGGGQGTLAVDALEAAGVALADLATGTRSALAELLGPAAAVANPVDLAGAADADPGRFVEAFERLTADPAVGAVLMVGLFGGYALRFDPGLAEVELTAAAGLAQAARTTGTTLIVHSVYAPEATPALLALRTEQVPVVESLEVACRCVGALAERGRALAAPAWEPLALGRSPGETGPVSALSEPEARGLLADAGVPLVPAVLCADVVEAVEAAERWPEATVLKAVADGMAHKSDHGGVALGLEGAEAVRVAFERMQVAVEAAGFAFRGALASPHVEPPLAELLVGVHTDPTFGPVLTVGAGGVWVETDGDTALRLLPVGEADVFAMLGELRIAARLAGLRGRPPADVPSVVAAALALTRLVVDHPSVVEAEVNPLFVYADRAVAVDARAYVADGPPTGAAEAADAQTASAPAAPAVSPASPSTGSSS